MPKVNQEYFEHKKETILDAAFAICKVKPMHQVTMKDIIRESGISQGGIYRYYKNVDEILVAVINRELGNTNYKEAIDHLIASSGTSAETIKGLLGFLSEYIDRNIDTLGKFQFEMTELNTYFPERMKSFSFQNKHINSMRYLGDRLFEAIRQGTASGEFTPVLPLEQVLSLVSVSIDGIVQDGIFHRCYGLPMRDFGFDIPRLFQSLTYTILHLLSVGGQNHEA